MLLAAVNGKPVACKYDLLCNICHDGKAGEGSYRIHVHRKVRCYSLLFAPLCVSVKVRLAHGIDNVRSIGGHIECFTTYFTVLQAACL